MTHNVCHTSDHVIESNPMSNKALTYVVNRLRREARRHLRERTDYCRTRAAELRYQADVIEKRKGKREMTDKRKAPKRVYLEIWPEGSRMTDAVHFEPVGCGEDFFGMGEASRIVVYERVSLSVLAQERKAKRR